MMVMHAATPALILGSDRAQRNHWCVPASFAHPAKLHLGLLTWIVERYTAPGDTLADPMAGIGSVALAATMQRHVVLREIEEPYVALAKENAARMLARVPLFAGTVEVAQHDARQPWDFMTDHLIFSPPYANRASVAKTTRTYVSQKKAQLLASDALGSRWRTFLERPTAGSSGAMCFHYGDHPGQVGHLRGQRYWAAMQDIYGNARAALRPKGLMIVVIKDHIAHGSRVPITAQTVAACTSLGFRLVARHQRQVFPLSLWERQRKARGITIVEEEDVLVFQ